VIVAVLGDTHLPRGSRMLSEECVRRLRAADAILHTGDHASLASFEALGALGPPVHAVHGNVDEPALRELLPAALEVDLGGVLVGMTHDPGPRAGRVQRLLARFPRCGAVVYGHTHDPEVAFHEGVWILNPGSPTERRRAPARTMLELRLGGGRLEPRLVDVA
jgi:putative phosphoesterase